MCTWHLEKDRHLYEDDGSRIVVHRMGASFVSGRSMVGVVVGFRPLGASVAFPCKLSCRWKVATVSDAGPASSKTRGGPAIWFSAVVFHGPCFGDSSAMTP